MLNGPSVARRTRRKPPSFRTSAERRLAGLGAQRLADLLGQRRRHADHRRGVVVEPADRIADIVGRPVGGDRLDQHPGAVGLQQLAHVPGAAARIAHVVQAVEHGDEVEVALGDLLGPAVTKRDAVGQDRGPARARWPARWRDAWKS